MLGYVRGIQRRLREMEFDVDLFDGPFFNRPKNGLGAIMDNKFVMQQAREGLTKIHNILTLDNVRNIFESEHSIEREANGFRNRLVFAIGLALGGRPTELCYMDASQFKLEKFNGKDSWVYYPKIISGIGESKNAKVGIRAVSYRNRHIPIHDVTFLAAHLIFIN